MKRRDFLTVGAAGALAAQFEPAWAQRRQAISVREDFPRLADEVFVDDAAGTPLSRFAEKGLERYIEFQRLGPGGGRREYVNEMLSEIRGLFARTVGARQSEIGLVHCTKDGEQKVLDALSPIRHGKSVVTNDLHFTGSLHNLIGLRKAGLDLRIVRAKNWRVRVSDMTAAIDERTALVAVSLVSNINGHVEPIREIAEAAHAHGALVYADIIQAAGIVPLNLRELGVDFAACSAYKWLYGVHGTGFLYVREELQGKGLPDRLFPGHVRHNYSPWVDEPEADADELIYTARTDATRYQPGHVSYLGYCALYESLKWIRGVGIESALRYSVGLNRRLLERIDRDRYELISPHADRSPIVTLLVQNPGSVQARLESARIKVSIAGQRIRVSPALYNTESDIDRLAETLNGV